MMRGRSTVTCMLTTVDWEIFAYCPGDENKCIKVKCAVKIAIATSAGGEN